MTAAGNSARSLPLILARELASNLATPMFLIDSAGTLVYFNEAAEVALGKPFAEVGEMPALDFGEMLQMTDPDGTPVSRRDSPAGIAYADRRPAHRTVWATGFDGNRNFFDATAYPLFGATDALDGVVTVFWPAYQDGG